MKNVNSLLLSPLQGGPGCEYCRITRDDIKRVLGFNSIKAFGSKFDYLQILAECCSNIFWQK